MSACLLLGLAIALVALPSPAAAQPITADRDAIRIAGTIGKGPLVGTMRLTASRDIGGLKLLVSDLLHDGSAPPARDPIAANAVTVSPPINAGRLAAGVQQFVLQVTAPSEIGRWKGNILLVWDKPAPGRMELPIEVTTRSQPSLALANPQQLNFAAAAGDSIQFRFHLKETSKGSPTTGVRVLTTDLRAATGSKLLRAEKFNAAPRSQVLAGGELMPVSVTIDLRDVESGKYAGQILVTDAYHNDVAVPLEVSVKDRWPLPLAVLLFGVLSGMTISGYRARGRTRDELIVRMDSINTQVATAGSLQKDLKPLVQRILSEVWLHIESKKWDAAREAAGRAEALTLRWRSDEDSWVKNLERMAKLEIELDVFGGATTISQQLKRRFDKLDLATVASAKDLADEIDKADDLLTFCKDVKALLAQIESEINSLASPALTRELSVEFATLKRKLLELKAEDKQAAETLLGDARALQEKVRAALEKHERLQEEISACTGSAEQIIAELEKVAATKAAQEMADRARPMLDDSAKEETLEIQQQLVENIWRGLWSAQHMLQLVSREPRSEEEKALAVWLSDARNYRQSAAQFKDKLVSLEARLPDTSWPGGVRPTEPELPRPREMRRKGASPESAIMHPDISFAAAPPDIHAEKPATGWRRRVLGGLRRLYPSAAAEQSRLRLNLFLYSTYALALGLLAWMGFTELYAASATFGADGAKDYLVLFLWGFGSEATRSGVTEVVKGLVPAS